MVAYDAGLAVPPGHHVHHINGVKTDNRIENLEVLPAAEHHRHHIREAGYIVNQFGTWPLLTDEERRQKWHEGYVRRRDRLRAEKAA
jgi:hypothetical protein